MAGRGGIRVLGKVIVLLILIAALAGGGLVWFDYLNVIDAKTVLAPLYTYIGRAGRTQETTVSDMPVALDTERLAVRLEALELRERELDKREEAITSREGTIEQMAQELEERQKALDDRERSLTALTQEAQDKSKNIDQLSRYLNGMPPESAVKILAQMDDQLAIDLLRKTEEIAQADGTASIVSYWFSLMDPARAAELQRKMAVRPSGVQ